MCNFNCNRIVPGKDYFDIQNSELFTDTDEAKNILITHLYELKNSIKKSVADKLSVI